MKKVLKILGWTFLGLIIVGNLVKFITKPIYENSLSAQVASANRDCPIPLGDGVGEVSSIKLEDDYVVYRINYQQPYYNKMSKATSRDQIKEILMMSILCMNGQDGQGDTLMDVLSSNDCGLKFLMSSGGGQRMEISANSDELRDIRLKYNQNPQEAMLRLLELQIEVENESLPIVIDEGMVMVDCSLSNGNIITTVNIDERIYSLATLKANNEQLKKGIIENGLNDPESKSLFDMCKVSHTGLVYRYVGVSSRKRVDIIITSDEIRQFDPTPSSLNIQ